MISCQHGSLPGLRCYLVAFWTGEARLALPHSKVADIAHIVDPQLRDLVAGILLSARRETPAAGGRAGSRLPVRSWWMAAPSTEYLQGTERWPTLTPRRR